MLRRLLCHSARAPGYIHGVPPGRHYNQGLARVERHEESPDSMYAAPLRQVVLMALSSF